MKERPILFSAPMVRAILEGRKMQTRRIISDRTQRLLSVAAQVGECYELGSTYPILAGDQAYYRQFSPYGQPSDRLWVREAWQYYDWTEDGEPCIRFAADNATSYPEVSEEWADRVVDVWEVLSREENYSIDNRARDRRWRPSIHIPRWASRILLEVASVRVERLQDISEADAAAEGTPWDDRAGNCREAYRLLWNQINGRHAWDANPWVWVIEFRRVQP